MLSECIRGRSLAKGATNSSCYVTRELARNGKVGKTIATLLNPAGISLRTGPNQLFFRHLDPTI